ncbi:MAG: ammonia-forming cytochrome c nitrite reductase subunit c552 [Bacillota bacterium]
MMKRKAFKVAIITGLVALIALAVSVTVSGASSKGELPKYLGSDACLGCHTDKFTNWEMTGHAHMLTQVFKWSDLPGDINAAPEELKAELMRADWIVAGQRFLARDPNDGALRYLNVLWNGQQYVPYKGGSNWETDCAGCHTTGWNKAESAFTEPGIGCEMCHGPGRDHVLGKGDISKIIVTDDAMTCGQCHTGGSLPDGTRWPEGFVPGQDMHAMGFQFPNIPDPHEGLFPNLTGYPKIRQYPLWEKSAHAQSMISLDANDHASGRCDKCHGAEALRNSLAGKPAPKDHALYQQGVTCSACHDPHNNTNEGQLRLPAEELCIYCHTASLAEGQSFTAGREIHHPMKEMLDGRGAIGVTDTKGAHSELTCIECHMTEGNHQMRVIKPGEVLEDAKRKDTCTSCHADSSKESRQVYLDMWQESTESRILAATEDLTVITANQNLLTDELKAKLAAAKTNLSFVEADASKGAHNFEYTIKVLNNVIKTLKEIRTAIGK